MSGQVLTRDDDVPVLIDFPELLRGVDGILWEADANTFQFLYVSPQTRTILGYEPDEWLESPTFWSDHLHPGDREWAVNFCVAQTGQGRDHDFEYRMVAKDGRIVWVRDLVWVVKDASGRASRLRGLLTDVTRRKGAEERAALQQECTSALAMGRTVDEAGPSFLEAIARRLGWPVATWWRAERGALRQAAQFDPHGLELANEADAGWTSFPSHVLASGASANTLHESAAGTLTRVAVAVRGRQGPLGVIELASPHTFQVPREDVTALESVAAQLAAFVEREMSQRELREREKKHLREVEAQRARLDAIIASVPGVVWEAWGEPDAKHQRIDFVSDHVERMLGYTREEWLATPNFWLSIVHPADRENAGRTAAAHFASGEGGSLEFRWLRKDGKPLWVRAWNMVIKDADGKPVGMRGVTLDITDRRSAEGALEKERTLLTAILDQMPAGVIITEPEGKLILANDQLNRILGHELIPAEGIEQYARYAVFRKDGTPMPVEEYPLARALLTGQPVTGEEVLYETPAREGRIHLHVNAAPVRDANGRTIAGIVTFIDITDRSRSEAALREKEALLAWQRRVLETIATGQPLHQTLDVLCREAEAHSPDHHFTVLLVDEDGKRLRHGAAPSLPAHYNEAVDGIAIGEGVGSCGTAAHRREAVVVEDIATDPLWRDFKALALPIGLRACWSTPIFGSDGTLLGTWAVYRKTPGEPQPHDHTMILVATRLAAIGIERARDEGQIRYQRDLVETITDNAASALFMMDGQGYPIFLNDAAKAMTGYESIDEIKHKPLHYAVHFRRPDGSPYPMEECPIDQANAEIRPLRDQREIFCRKDGALFPVEYNVAPVILSDGTKGAVIEVRDITKPLADEMELRARAEELARLTDALSRSNLELDQFAYVTSHDLKAPLRGIANLSRWIEEDLSDRVTPESRQHLDLLRGRVNRMDSLIDAILEYSRIGRIHQPAEQVEVGKLIRDTIELIAPPPNFKIEVPEAMPSLRTPRTQLQQVFMNLIGNAIKHHDKEEGTVRIGVEDADTHWRFSVSDDGPGIPSRFRDRVFVIFQTLRPRDKVEGTGVGLALVKKIVESQGGTISLDSDEGRGATFHFTWPKVPREANP